MTHALTLLLFYFAGDDEGGARLLAAKTWALYAEAAEVRPYAGEWLAVYTMARVYHWKMSTPEWHRQREQDCLTTLAATSAVRCEIIDIFK